MQSAIDIEHRINKLRNKLRKKHLKDLESGEVNMQGALIYSMYFLH